MSSTVMTDSGLSGAQTAPQITATTDDLHTREVGATIGTIKVADPKISCSNVNVFYGDKHAIIDVSLDIGKNEVVAFIGPSGCGKSTFLRSLNRMNDTIDGCRVTGNIILEDDNIYNKKLDVVQLRARVGMVFQKPNPFPKTIYQNIAWGPKINGMKDHMDDRVQQALEKAALWNEVKDKLHQSGLSLSGGQQQRLCIARTIAMEPEVILMDEPCSALDPISTGRIEDLIFELKKKYSIVIVTHNMQQAARVSDFTVFMYQGDVIEYGPTERIFTRPQKKQTEDYVRGKFG